MGLKGRSGQRPHVNKANTYARGVVAGRILAGKWVKLACGRHLDDLRRSRSASYPYVFDRDAAERVCAFAELMPHVKGHWAGAGDETAQRIQLEPWQCFVLASVFGWMERRTGFRRFRIAYVEVPRKNGKSSLGAVVGNYCLAAEQEPGAEIYSGATSEKQAWEVFRPAKQMAQRTPAFREIYGVQVNAKGMVIPANGSRFEPVIGKPGDGASPSLAIVDEYHEHPDSTLYDTMITGMGARRQPLMLVITTAGTDTGGACFALHEQVQRMLDGTKPDDRLWGCIYSIDAEDNWTDDAALRKANPNYGVSVSADFLQGQQREAIANARKQSVFKTKHLNVWVTARDAWLNMEWWHRQADPTMQAEDFAGEPCFFGADLASRLDLAAVARVFRRDVEGEAHYYAFVRTYCPLSTVEDPARAHYQQWAAEGWLIATDGDDTDHRRIADDVAADAGAGGLAALAVDPWNSSGLTTLVRESGLSESVIVEVPQTTAHLSSPMKDLEAAVKSGRFHHDGNPCLAWQMSNVTCREDANENIFPRKERPENKIDAAVALINAMSRAVVHEAGAGDFSIGLI